MSKKHRRKKINEVKNSKRLTRVSDKQSLETHAVEQPSKQSEASGTTLSI